MSMNRESVIRMLRHFPLDVASDLLSAANVDWQHVAEMLPFERIYVDGVQYMTRHFLSPMVNTPETKNGERILLHQFHTGDEDRRLHNHPWDWAESLILKGGYTEQRARGFTRSGSVTTWSRYEAGDVVTLSGMDWHRVVSVDPGTWTLFRHGPRVKSWGFLDESIFDDGQAVFMVEDYVSGAGAHSKVEG